jgi:hypothetical protein
MPKDWTRIAEGLNLGVPAAELAAIAPLLDTLSQTVEPLTRRLAPDTDMAVTMAAPPEKRP